MNFEETVRLFFWTLTALNVVVSMRFVRGLRRLHAVAPSPCNLIMARSHRKDLWLLAAIIWIAALFRDWDYVFFFTMSAALIQVWLVQRTLARLRMLTL